MPCRIRPGKGSGFTKEPDTAAAKQAEQSLKELIAARAAQDAKLFPPITKK